MKPRDIFAYLFLAVTWGLSFLVLIKVVHGFGWVGATAFRALVAAAILAGFSFVAKGKLSFNISTVGLCIVGATTVAGQLLGLSYATMKLGSALSAILVATTPISSAIISYVFGLQKTSTRGFFGLIFGLVGVVFVVGFPALPFNQDFVMGSLAGVLESVCAAAGSVYAGTVLKKSDPVELSIGAFFTGGLMSLPMVLLVPPEAVPQLPDYFWLLVLAVVMSAVNYVLFFGLISSIGATKAISVEFLVTVIAVFAGTMLAHETLNVMQLLGAGLIVVGCALVLGSGTTKQVLPALSG
jgi:drug/metabolite transporter (DMT)-like permease